MIIKDDTCMRWRLTRAGSDQGVQIVTLLVLPFYVEYFWIATSGSFSTHTHTHHIPRFSLFFFSPLLYILPSLSLWLSIMASSAASILQRQYKGMVLYSNFYKHISLTRPIMYLSRAYTTPRSGLCGGSQEWQHFRMVHPILYFIGFHETLSSALGTLPLSDRQRLSMKAATLR